MTKRRTTQTSKVLLQSDIDNMKKDIQTCSYVVCPEFFLSAREL